MEDLKTPKFDLVHDMMEQEERLAVNIHFLNFCSSRCRLSVESKG
jgi:hypothetical protein